MFSSILALAALASGMAADGTGTERQAAAPLAQQAIGSQNGVEVIYAVAPSITLRNLGSHTPSRADQRHCEWTAKLVVTRQLAASGHPSRAIHQGPVASGHHYGPCHGQEAALRAAALRALGDPASMLQQVAQADHAMLLAESEALQGAERKAGG